MLDVTFIDSLDLPELAPYRTMRRSVEHERRGIFVAEGEKVVRRLFETRLGVISVLVTAEWLERFRPQLEARPERVRAFVGEKRLLESMVGFQLYHGVLALAEVPAAVDLEATFASSPPPRLLVALDGLASAENLGVVVRNCAAFRVQALIIGETCTSPWLRRAVRNSMGGIFHVPVIRTASLADSVRALTTRGVRVVAAHPHASGRRLGEADLSGDCCLLFGSEGHGISPAVLDACPEHVAVPMPAQVDSLNVSSAVAVFLYEADRQRQARRVEE